MRGNGRGAVWLCKCGKQLHHKGRCRGTTCNLKLKKFKRGFSLKCAVGSLLVYTRQEYIRGMIYDRFRDLKNYKCPECERKPMINVEV